MSFFAPKAVADEARINEFAEFIAGYVLFEFNSRDSTQYPQFRQFAQSVNANADAETIDNEILCFNAFNMTQMLAQEINDHSCLDQLVPRFYALIASQRKSESPRFESIPMQRRFVGYLESYNLDLERMRETRKGTIPWKFMLSQLGRNLRGDFDIERDYSEFVPASIALSSYFVENSKFTKMILDKVGWFRTGKS